MSAVKEKPGSVMVHVGLDRIGDSLLKLPFVLSLRAAYPEARITWVAGKDTSLYAGRMAPTVVGLLDEVIESAGIGQRPIEFLKRRALPGRRFDVIIDTQKIVWATLSLRRIPHKLFISPAAKFLLSSRRPPPNHPKPRSMIRQMLDLLELASGQKFPTPDRIDLRPSPELAALAAQLLPPGPTYVAIAPGSGGPPKCWPLDNFLGLARIQVARGRTPAFIIGPMELDWLPRIRAAVPEAVFPLQSDAISTTHCYSPLLTIALAGHVAAAAANDSGAAHMMAIGGAPLVVLYGVTQPGKFVPMTDRLTIIRAQDFGGRELHWIPLNPVADAVDAAVASGAAGR
ncbi:MAG: lipopolysaccharide heptosyltransferase family protein [Rhodospirillales bacterium]|nr:lipopolysaccharide heptosyltransferase family protein [Rhodospirillales bacterium]